MKRKEFLTTACGVCGFGFLAGVILTQESCTPKAGAAATKLSVEEGKVLVPLEIFGANNILTVKVKGREDIGLVKKEDGTVLAFDMTCPHQGATVKARDGKFFCPAHGSVFSAQGKLEKGPARTALKQYKASVVADKVEVLVS